MILTKILIVEDDKSTRELLREIFSLAETPAGEKYEVLVFDNGKKAVDSIASLDREEAIFLVLDINLPIMTGWEVLRHLKELGEKEDRFIFSLVMTGAIQQELAQEKEKLGMDDADWKTVQRVLLSDKKSQLKLLGAQEVLEKPIYRMELYAQLKIFSEALEKAKSRATNLRRDSVTNFYNRQQGEERVREEMERAKRNGNGLAILFIDIDHFREVNTAYGHDVGTKVLGVIGQRIGDQIRPYDIPVRYGGDEFYVILTETNRKEAIKNAHRIRESIANPVILFLSEDKPEAEKPIPGEAIASEVEAREGSTTANVNLDSEQLGEEKEIPTGEKQPKLRKIVIEVSASVGVALFGSDSSADRLIKRADDAMYKSKDQGRNRVEVA